MGLFNREKKEPEKIEYNADNVTGLARLKYARVDDENGNSVQYKLPFIIYCDKATAALGQLAAYYSWPEVAPDFNIYSDDKKYILAIPVCDRKYQLPVPAEIYNKDFFTNVVYSLAKYYHWELDD